MVYVIFYAIVELILVFYSKKHLTSADFSNTSNLDFLKFLNSTTTLGTRNSNQDSIKKKQAMAMALKFT